MLADYTARRAIEIAEDWTTWATRIPTFAIPEGVQVKLQPPYMCAMVRVHLEANGRSASIYLDVSDTLGTMGEPYWELFDGGECHRFLMGEVSELEQCIRETLGSDALNTWARHEEAASMAVEQEHGQCNDCEGRGEVGHPDDPCRKCSTCDGSGEL